MSGGYAPDRSRRVPGSVRHGRRVGDERRGVEAASRDVVCDLCPRGCRIPPNHAGDCRVRINVDGRLVASTFGRPCALHLDPIDKKPLFHVLPGTRILSVATVGCNLHCTNCQNHNISQRNPWDESVRVTSVVRGAFGATPEELVRAAKWRRCPSIAATYTEPVVFYEYTKATAVKAREAGLKTVTVTAGYINPGPLRSLCRVIDASNVDVKTMRPSAFLSNSGGVLKHVLRGLVIARESGVWLEITSLVIPGFNDSSAEMKQLCRFVRRELGAHTPVHFSRFFPHHRMRNRPPTPIATLERVRKIALDEGLVFPYVGNLPGNDGEHTYCPGCGKVIIERVGYRIRSNNLTDGKCGHCGRELEGVWR